MTRLIKFLNESKYEQFNIENQSLLETFIKNDCKQFLKEASKDTLLYRGMNLDNEHFFYKFKTNKNREPKDSSKEFHNLLDLGFKQVFGKKLRSETVFAIGSKTVSEEYGNPYVCIPCDNYKIYWSPKIDDIYEILSNENAWFTCNDADALLGLLLLFYNQTAIIEKWLISSKLRRIFK